MHRSIQPNKSKITSGPSCDDMSFFFFPPYINYQLGYSHPDIHIVVIIDHNICKIFRPCFEG
jgi:hypothetical protein